MKTAQKNKALKATGMVRKLDSLGRIVIPSEVRKTLGWEPGVPIEMFTNENTVVLSEYSTRCPLTGEREDLVHIPGIGYISEEAYAAIKKHEEN